jgi:biopolymer transport protein ExbB
MNKRFKHVLTIAVVLSATLVFSQIQTSGSTPVPTPATVTEEISALEFLMKGGVFLIPIVLLLFYTLVVIIEKFRYLRRVTKFNKNILHEIKQNLETGNLNTAIESLNRDTTAFASVLKEGVLTIGRPINEVESNMDKMANIEIGKMEKNMGHLGLIAGIAPTLGFIGTIAGVIKIFYSISVTENVSIGNISGGLYEKMISSGSGLIVGIIAYAAYHLLNGMIDAYLLKIQQLNLDFVNLIQRPDNGNKAK